jgi:hypothetical protein
MLCNLKAEEIGSARKSRSRSIGEEWVTESDGHSDRWVHDQAAESLISDGSAALSTHTSSSSNSSMHNQPWRRRLAAVPRYNRVGRAAAMGPCGSNSVDAQSTGEGVPINGGDEHRCRIDEGVLRPRPGACARRRGGGGAILAGAYYLQSGAFASAFGSRMFQSFAEWSL